MQRVPPAFSTALEHWSDPWFPGYPLSCFCVSLPKPRQINVEPCPANKSTHTPKPRACFIWFSWSQDFKSISVTSYTPLGWCVGFLGAFLRVLTGRVIVAALSRSRLLDPSQSAEDLGLFESDEDTWPEWVLSLLLGIYREHMQNSGKEDKHKTNNLVSSFLNMPCNNLENVRLIC